MFYPAYPAYICFTCLPSHFNGLMPHACNGGLRTPAGITRSCTLCYNANRCMMTICMCHAALTRYPNGAYSTQNSYFRKLFKIINYKMWDETKPAPLMTKTSCTSYKGIADKGFIIDRSWSLYSSSYTKTLAELTKVGIKLGILDLVVSLDIGVDLYLAMGTCNYQNSNPSAGAGAGLGGYVAVAAEVKLDLIIFSANLRASVTLVRPVVTGFAFWTYNMMMYGEQWEPSCYTIDLELWGFDIHISFTMKIGVWIFAITKTVNIIDTNGFRFLAWSPFGDGFNCPTYSSTYNIPYTDKLALADVTPPPPPGPPGPPSPPPRPPLPPSPSPPPPPRPPFAPSEPSAPSLAPAILQFVVEWADVTPVVQGMVIEDDFIDLDLTVSWLVGKTIYSINVEGYDNVETSSPSTSSARPLPQYVQPIVRGGMHGGDNVITGFNNESVFWAGRYGNDRPDDSIYNICLTLYADERNKTGLVLNVTISVYHEGILVRQYQRTWDTSTSKGLPPGDICNSTSGGFMGNYDFNPRYDPNLPAFEALPDYLRPEVANFDAFKGIVYSTSSSSRPLIRAWSDADGAYSKRDGAPAVLDFTGNCVLFQDTSTAAIAFDSNKCSSFGYSLPKSWNTSAGGAFTVVWIGSLDFPPYFGPVTLLSIGSPSRGFSWTSQYRRAQAKWKNDGNGFFVSSSDVPAPPEKHWTMEVTIRRGRGTGISCHRYNKQSPYLQSWYFESQPSEIVSAFAVGSDLLNTAGQLRGKVSVVLIYNRALPSNDLLALASFYAKRFAWAKPVGDLPAFRQLPEKLLPEVASFDALINIVPAFTSSNSTSALTPVKEWLDSDGTYRKRGWPPVFINLIGNCVPYFDGLTAAITFDGATCTGVSSRKLPKSWDESARAAFTMVWIGRFTPNVTNKKEQVLMTLSRTKENVKQELYWDSTRRFINSTELNFGFDIRSSDMPSTPAGLWTMEVLARPVGAASVSYYRYNRLSPYLQSWNFPSKPLEIFSDALTIGSDTRFPRRYLDGQVSVVLLYNRALSGIDLIDLASVYGKRFAWSTPAGARPGYRQLPDNLRPEVVNFDAQIGIVQSNFNVAQAGVSSTSSTTSVVRVWLDADGDNSKRGGLPVQLNFTGNCSIYQDAFTDAIAFDGDTCAGYGNYDLPSSWNKSGEAAFTAVWIGSFTPNVSKSQMLMTLSRTKQDFEEELYWESTYLFAYASGYGFELDNSSVPAAPTDMWTLEAIVRPSGATSVSYYRYNKQNPYLQSWFFSGKPSKIFPDSFAIGADIRDDDGKFLNGKVSVILIYNRALSTSELVQLSSFYSNRFSWPKPTNVPPPPPTKDCQGFSGYIATPKADHNGDDIVKYSSLATAARECLQSPRCKGFNTDGWVKTTAAPLAFHPSMCFYTKGCPRPDGWCNHKGSVFRQLDCDGDGALDLTCFDNDGRRWALLSKNGCVGDGAGKTPVDVCPAGFGCSRPADSWCNHKGSVFRQLDCDGDGALDLTCSDNDGRRWALLSKNGCAGDGAGKTPVDVCPAGFGCSRPADSWCNHKGSVFRQLDCDGDGALDLTCSDNDGRRWALLSKNGCAGDGAGKTPVDVCPAGFGCPRPDGWCNQKGSVFRQLDCDGDGALDLTCSDNDGGRWAILSKNGCAADWAGGRPVDVCPASFGCPRPDGWCNHKGSVFRQLDCDGDGALDLTCFDKDGGRWALLSKNGCAGDGAGKTPVDVCPAGFRA
ncbi:hypothetical protein Vafri_17315 [Volvox africanus]|uniref:Uncharacterized protein n=1 Tax=Volvox africanus TaxID=51714 RepID=A0A8J4FAQ6_9CHLO|nr:hypothetical protein Vafri_17315 [Volvox africanus]